MFWSILIRVAVVSTQTEPRSHDETIMEPPAGFVFLWFLPWKQPKKGDPSKKTHPRTHPPTLLAYSASATRSTSVRALRSVRWILSWTTSPLHSNWLCVTTILDIPFWLEPMHITKRYQKRIRFGTRYRCNQMSSCLAHLCLFVGDTEGHRKKRVPSGYSERT